MNEKGNTKIESVDHEIIAAICLKVFIFLLQIMMELVSNRKYLSNLLNKMNRNVTVSRKDGL